MAGKSERAVAWEVIREYHAARLTELLERVGDAVDRMRAGEINAFEADEVIFQYSRAAKELWKFCNLGDVYFTAQEIRENRLYDWWALGAPKRRHNTESHPAKG